MLSIINPVPLIIIFVTVFGILMHDTRIDKAASVAVATPGYASSSSAYEKAISPNYHTHVERVSVPKFATNFRSSLPNIQPPRDDERKYIQNKKLMFMGGGSASSLWPSV